MKIAPAEPDHSEMIWRWRNDPITRAMFRSTDPVLRADHDRWFKSVLSRSDRMLFVGIDNDTPIGVVRFDGSSNRKSWGVSINLSPDARGKGLSLPLLSSAIAEMRKTLSQEHLCLIADVRSDNGRSNKLFQKADFRLISEAHGFKHYCLRICPNEVGEKAAHRSSG